MIKVGIADYGMSVWDGGLFDYEQRCQDIKAIGYDGLERLRPVSESDAIHKSALVRKLGMDYATCYKTGNVLKNWSAAVMRAGYWLNMIPI